MNPITLTIPREKFLTLLQTSEQFREFITDNFFSSGDIKVENDVPVSPSYEYLNDVDSSVIKDIRYYRKDSVLYIRFRHTNSVYRYEQVPYYRWCGFQTNPGGTYYNHHIKGQYNSTRIENFPS